MNVEIRRGSDRFVDRVPGRATKHGFSFGPHYDPERLAFGPMVCHDDHLVGSGQGFETHRHTGLEIVTWVVSGALEHVGPDGTHVVVPTGGLASLSTGTGTEHSEHATAHGPARFVQVWLTASEEASERPPSYVVHPVETRRGALVAPFTHATEAGEHIMWVAELDAGDVLALPAAPLAHVFVTTGALLRFSLAEPLAAGDAMLLTDEPSHEVTAAVPTQLLVWTFSEAADKG